MKRETHIFEIKDIATNVCTIFEKIINRPILKKFFCLNDRLKTLLLFIFEKRNKKLQVFIGFLILISNKHANHLGK